MLPQSRAISVNIALWGVGERSHMTKERLTPDTSMSICCSPDLTHVLCRFCRNSHAACTQPDDKNIKSNLPCTPCWRRATKKH